MMLRTSRTSIRYRPGLAVGVALVTAAQGVATLASKSERWVGHWPSTSAVVGWATLWGACIAAGAAAWVVAAPRRDGYHLLVLASSRTQSQIHRGGMLSVAAGTLKGYGVVAGYAIWMTAPRAVHGGPSVLEFLTTLAAVPMAVGLGAAAGRVTPPTLAPVVGALSPFVLYVCLLYAGIRINQVALMDIALVDHVDRTYLRLPNELLLARPIFWAALGVALLSWAFAANRLAYSFTLLAGFAASVVLLAGGARISAPWEYAALCVDDRPRVCVDAAHQHLLNEYRSRIAGSLAKMHGLDLSDATIVPREDVLSNSLKYAGTVPGSSPSRQIVVPILTRNTTMAHEIAGRTFPASVGSAIFLSSCFEVPDGLDRPARTDAGLRTAIILHHWWLSIHNLPANGGNYVGELDLKSMMENDSALTEAAQHFAALSDKERAVWMAEQREQILSCTAVPPR